MEFNEEKWKIPLLITSPERAWQMSWHLDQVKQNSKIIKIWNLNTIQLTAGPICGNFFFFLILFFPQKENTWSQFMPFYDLFYCIELPVTYLHSYVVVLVMNIFVENSNVYIVISIDFECHCAVCACSRCLLYNVHVCACARVCGCIVWHHSSTKCLLLLYIYICFPNVKDI